MVLLEKRVYQGSLGFLEFLAGKDSKEIKGHLDTEGRMVFLERKVSRNLEFQSNYYFWGGGRVSSMASWEGSQHCFLEDGCLRAAVGQGGSLTQGSFGGPGWLSLGWTRRSTWDGLLQALLALWGQRALLWSGFPTAHH